MGHSNNPFEVIDTAESGVSLEFFDDLVSKSGYSKAAIAEFIGIDARTISNYKRANKNLVKTDAEHLIKLKELFEKGGEVFGNYVEFGKWLEIPSHGLGGRIPESLLNYISGIDLVRRELIRIEFGDFS